jgi:hypothetical protein
MQNSFAPRGRGECRVPAHPQPVCIGSKHTVVTTSTPKHPAFPHAMVLTAYAALSSATNSSCHRHRRIDGMPKPGWADDAFADLTPATGARTTRFCRTRPPAPKASTGLVPVRRSFSEGGFSAVRLHAVDSSQAFRQPALPLRRAPDAAASTASHPASVTIAIRPSWGRDSGGYTGDLGQAKTGIFLETRLDRPNHFESFQ